MKVYVDRVLRVRPEMNPELALPEKVESRPGISHAPAYEPDENDWTTKGGLRAIEHFLQTQGYAPKDERIEFVFTA